MRVALLAQLGPGSGGIETVVIGLANGLSGLADADDEYVFLTLEGRDDWLRPYVSGPCRILTVPAPGPWPNPDAQPSPALVRGAARIAPGIERLYRRLRPPYGPARSTGVAERLGADVMHFPYQAGFLTDIPSIYQPHDLQHLHLPQFFDREEIRRREVSYRSLCRQAKVVVVETEWIRDDVLERYGLPPDKVAIIPFAPILDVFPALAPVELARVREALRLPDAFVYYPAQLWPHKNHVNLMRALALLREAGTVVPIVFSGVLDETYHPALVQEAARLGITDQVHWVGFVSQADVRALYSLARAVVIPTLFEAASMLLWEAFQAGVPAACSNATSLPQQSGDAALVFDPHDVADIADAIRRLWVDDELCRTLVARGTRRIADLSWSRTAQLYRDQYRRVAAEPRR
jgi:glycosyltransferase involved in cell wall biosynthesis